MPVEKLPTGSNGNLHLFDDLASTYEDWFRTPLGALVSRRERELLTNLLAPSRGDRILEVGAGTGHFLRGIAARGANCVGLDPSRPMLQAALSRSEGSGTQYVTGRAEDLPFSHEAFDAVLCMTVLEFVDDVEAAVNEAARAVRSGGRLVFGVLNANSPWAAVRRREGGLWSRARFFHEAELRRLLAPFGTFEVAYCVHLPPKATRLPGVLLDVADRAMSKLRYRSGALCAVRITKGGA